MSTKESLLASYNDLTEGIRQVSPANWQEEEDLCKARHAVANELLKNHRVLMLGVNGDYAQL